MEPVDIFKKSSLFPGQINPGFTRQPKEVVSERRGLVLTRGQQRLQRLFKGLVPEEQGMSISSRGEERFCGLPIFR